MKRSKIKSLAGFTIIELIVVMGIIGILLLAVTPAISGYMMDKKEETANENSKVVYMAFQKYLTKCEIEHVVIDGTGTSSPPVYSYAIGNDTYNNSTGAWTVDQKNYTASGALITNFDISNNFSNDIRNGKWMVKIKQTSSGDPCEYTIDYATWTPKKAFTYVTSNIASNTYKLNTITKQDTFYKTNKFALGTYPMG